MTAGIQPSGTEHPGETNRGYSWLSDKRGETEKIIWYESAKTLVAPHCHFLKVLGGGADGNFRTSQVLSTSQLAHFLFPGELSDTALLSLSTCGMGILLGTHLT